MTSISLIAPYAPQPAVSSVADAGVPATQTTLPSTGAASSSNAGTASDQSGTGAGNGTGTGGAFTAALLDRARGTDKPLSATPRSVVEAQSKSDETATFLAEQQAQKAQARSDETARADAQQARAKAQDRAEAEAASRADEFKMPNPLPTAPILETDDA